MNWSFSFYILYVKKTRPILVNKTKRLAPISWSVGALFFSRTADHAPSSARPLSLRDVWSMNFFFFG